MMRYKNQSVLLASMHEKERAIAPAFWDKLSCSILVKDFNTDQFGTFTGEVPRIWTPYETCVLKAKNAAKQHGFNLSVASEGSFGAHPHIPFVPVDHEIMVFVDLENNWIIVEQIRSEETNYATKIIDKNTELSSFLEHVKFPSHALTLQTEHEKRVIAKGIQNLELLHHYCETEFKKEERLLLATDMRAMMNPTRMRVIQKLAEQLTSRILSACPACESPGFGFKETKGCLPCDFCHAPTSLYAEEVYGCVACKYQCYQPRKDGLLTADPMYCSYCNP